VESGFLSQARPEIQCRFGDDGYWSSRSQCHEGGTSGECNPSGLAAYHSARPLLVEAELGGGCAATLLLARSDAGAIWMSGVVAYSTGFTFVQIGISRSPSGPTSLEPGGGPMFELAFAGGPAVTARSVRGTVEGNSDLLSLASLRAYFNSARWIHHWSVRPLPPPGQIEFTTRWLDAGIGDTTVSTDIDELIRASKRARPLWSRR
jgi:hypothetical protein